MPVTRPTCVPDTIRTVGDSHFARAQITLDSSVLLLFRAFIHFEGYWACLVLVVIDTTDKARSTQPQCLAIVGKRTKEEREREKKKKKKKKKLVFSWSARPDRGQGAKCLPRKSRRSVSCSLLQFSSCSGPKSLGRPARIALDFLSAESLRVFSQKLSNRIGYSGVFCDTLRLFEGYYRKRTRIWLKAYGTIAFVKFSKKVPTLPLFQFFFSFFFQEIDERLNEIRQSQKSCTSRRIDFTHVKLKTRSTPFTMYGRECGAAWPNPGLWPFAGRPPVKSKCMGFAGSFARWPKCRAEVANFIKPSELRFSSSSLCSWWNRLLMLTVGFWRGEVEKFVIFEWWLFEIGQDKIFCMFV